MNVNCFEERVCANVTEAEGPHRLHASERWIQFLPGIRRSVNRWSFHSMKYSMP